MSRALTEEQLCFAALPLIALVTSLTNDPLASAKQKVQARYALREWDYRRVPENLVSAPKKRRFKFLWWGGA